MKIPILSLLPFLSYPQMVKLLLPIHNLFVELVFGVPRENANFVLFSDSFKLLRYDW